MIYAHTQPGAVIRISMGIGALVAAGFSAHHRLIMDAPWRLAAGPLLVAAVLALAAYAMGSLTVQVDTDTLRLWFGPGWIRKTIPLRDIVHVQPARNTWRHGWGIHCMRNGWVYNVSGFDAVELQLKGGRLVRIGTDDPAGLEAALKRVVP